MEGIGVGLTDWSFSPHVCWSPLLKLLSPLARVPIFLCIGLNYHLHAKETNQPVPRTPVLFTKPSNALNSPGEPVVIPKCATNNQADYEVEMAIVMGRTGKDIKEGEVMDYVAGYTVGGFPKEEHERAETSIGSGKCANLTHSRLARAPQQTTSPPANGKATSNPTNGLSPNPSTHGVPSALKSSLPL